MAKRGKPGDAAANLLLQLGQDLADDRDDAAQMVPNIPCRAREAPRWLSNPPRCGNPLSSNAQTRWAGLAAVGRTSRGAGLAGFERPTRRAGLAHFERRSRQAGQPSRAPTRHAA